MHQRKNRMDFPEFSMKTKRNLQINQAFDSSFVLIFTLQHTVVRGQSNMNVEALTIKTTQEINPRGITQRLGYHENCPQGMESNSALVVIICKIVSIYAHKKTDGTQILTAN